MIFNDKNAPGFPVIVAMHINPTGGANGPWAPWTGTLTVGDIEIGAVELKNATTDDRALVTASGMVTVHETADYTVVEVTGAAAVSITVNPTTDFFLEEVRIHLSAAGTAGNLTIVQDAGAGPAFDTTLLTQDMTAVVDYPWVPVRHFHFEDDDNILITWANASNRTYGIQILYTTA